MVMLDFKVENYPLVKASIVCGVPTLFIIILLSVPISGGVKSFLSKFLNFIGIEEAENENEDYVQKLKSDFGIQSNTDAGIENNILTLMIRNMAEIREYFKISKQNAKRSYLLSLWMAVFGFILFAFAVVMFFFIDTTEPALYAVIGGFVTEFVSVVAMQLHRNSQRQLNHYYQALHENEKFLSSVQLAEKISKNRRDEVYIEIIRCSVGISQFDETISQPQYEEDDRTSQ